MTAAITETVLVTGAAGQLGSELAASTPTGVRLVACDVDALDIRDAGAVRDRVREIRPRVVINAAAFTAVDAAESDAANAEAINARGAKNIAEAASAVDARLVHVSTDFVFDGTRGSPYAPGDATNPLNVYGATKLAGEQAVRESHPDWLILRTAWVYAADGRNFVNTMLRLMRVGDDIRVVDDQVGTPTWARSLARAVWRAIDIELRGLHHWTDAGVASWYDFAVAIQEEALALGLLDSPVRVHPIGSNEYPTAARRPAYSVLDKQFTWRSLEMVPAHWRANLRAMLEEIASLKSGTA